MANLVSTPLMFDNRSWTFEAKMYKEAVHNLYVNVKAIQKTEMYEDWSLVRDALYDVALKITFSVFLRVGLERTELMIRVGKINKTADVAF